jgi:hypothetical protein
MSDISRVGVIGIGVVGSGNAEAAVPEMRKPRPGTCQVGAALEVLPGREDPDDR